MSRSGPDSFGDVLDRLMGEPVATDDTGPSPTLQGDLLDQIDRLRATGGLSREADGDLAYREVTLAPHVLDALDEIMPDLSVDPADIALELGLRPDATSDYLDGARRRFALQNHPDRLAPRLRERAATRMAIANSLIDKAKHGQ